MFQFGLGDKVRDPITGFEGIVRGRTEWINGCLTYVVKPLKLKDGLLQDNQYFDEQDLVLVAKRKLAKAAAATGGPVRAVPEPNR